MHVLWGTWRVLVAHSTPSAAGGVVVGTRAGPMVRRRRSVNLEVKPTDRGESSCHMNSRPSPPRKCARPRQASSHCPLSNPPRGTPSKNAAAGRPSADSPSPKAARGSPSSPWSNTRSAGSSSCGRRRARSGYALSPRTTKRLCARPSRPRSTSSTPRSP